MFDNGQQNLLNSNLSSGLGLGQISGQLGGIQTSGYQAPVGRDLGKLIEALAAAQNEFEPIKKTKTNKFLDSKYADLEDVISATQPALRKHGLVVFQTLGNSEDGKSVTITTRLAHISNQYIESTLAMPIGEMKHQAIGAAITYGRKYAYQAIIGVAAELDDDGNANAGAVETVQKPDEKPKKKYEPKPGPPPTQMQGDLPPITKVPKAAIPPPVETVEGGRFPTKDEMSGFVKRTRHLIEKTLPAQGIENGADLIKEYIMKKSGVHDTKLLTFVQWTVTLDQLEKVENIKNLLTNN